MWTSPTTGSAFLVSLVLWVLGYVAQWLQGLYPSRPHLAEVLLWGGGTIFLPSDTWRGHETCFGQKYEQESLRAASHLGLQGATRVVLPFVLLPGAASGHKGREEEHLGPTRHSEQTQRSLACTKHTLPVAGNRAWRLLRGVRRNSGQIRGLASLTVRELLEGRTSNISALRGEGPHAD